MELFNIINNNTANELIGKRESYESVFQDQFNEIANNKQLPPLEDIVKKSNELYSKVVNVSKLTVLSGDLLSLSLEIKSNVQNARNKIDTIK